MVNKQLTLQQRTKLLLTPCKTRLELKNWIHYHLGLDLPDCTVSRYADSNPLDSIWQIYDICVNKNNPDGYGAKVWIRDGNFFYMRETFDRWIDLGVGNRAVVDVVGVRWPTGITQNSLNVRTGKKDALEIKER